MRRLQELRRVDQDPFAAGECCRYAKATTTTATAVAATAISKFDERKQFR